MDALWSVEVQRESGHWVLPDGCCTLSIGLTPDWYVRLRGPSLTPFCAPATDGEQIVGVRFRPGVDPGRMNWKRLRRGQSADEALDVVQRAIDGEQDPRVDRMVTLVRNRRGAISVSELAEEAGVSERQLERVMTESIGLGPNAFARVTRLQCVVRRMVEARDASLAGIAAEFGYVDQTHMTREFSSTQPSVPMSGGAARMSACATSVR